MVPETNHNTESASCIGLISKESRPVETLEESLNHRIKYAREQVERLCILKAKAETAGLLQYPANFLSDLFPY